MKYKVTAKQSKAIKKYLAKSTTAGHTSAGRQHKDLYDSLLDLKELTHPRGGSLSQDALSDLMELIEKYDSGSFDKMELGSEIEKRLNDIDRDKLEDAHGALRKTFREGF